MAAPDRRRGLHDLTTIPRVREFESETGWLQDKSFFE